MKTLLLAILAITLLACAVDHSDPAAPDESTGEAAQAYQYETATAYEVTEWGWNYDTQCNSGDVVVAGWCELRRAPGDLSPIFATVAYSFAVHYGDAGEWWDCLVDVGAQYHAGETVVAHATCAPPADQPQRVVSSSVALAPAYGSVPSSAAAYAECSAGERLAIGWCEVTSASGGAHVVAEASGYTYEGAPRYGCRAEQRLELTGDHVTAHALCVGQ